MGIHTKHAKIRNNMMADQRSRDLVLVSAAGYAITELNAHSSGGLDGIEELLAGPLSFCVAVPAESASDKPTIWMLWDLELTPEDQVWVADTARRAVADFYTFD